MYVKLKLNHFVTDIHVHRKSFYWLKHNGVFAVGAKRNLLSEECICQNSHSKRDLRIDSLHISLLKESSASLTYIPYTFMCLWSSVSVLPHHTLSVSSFTNGNLDELVSIHVRKCGGICRRTDRKVVHLYTKSRRRYLELVVACLQ